MIVDMKKYMISCIASLLSLSLFPVQVSCDVPDESSHPVIPVSLSPIDTAHAIREQVKDAALRVEAETLQQIQLVEQLESVMNAQRDAMDTAMNASPDAPGQNAVSQEEIAAPDPAPADVSWTGTVLINTADTVPADSSRMETEAQTEKETEKRPETETETQLSEETEAQFHPPHSPRCRHLDPPACPPHRPRQDRRRARPESIESPVSKFLLSLAGDRIR